MQDKNFEQQAHEMANGFKMEPSPASWQQIQDVIGKKRKRRIAVWWWLLPLCAACGIALYTLQQTNKQVVAAKNILVNSKVKSKNTEEQTTLIKPQKENEKFANSKFKSKNLKEQIQLNTTNKNNKKQEAKINEMLAAALGKENNVAVIKENKNDKQIIYSSINKPNSTQEVIETNAADADKNAQLNKDIPKIADTFMVKKTPEIISDKTFDTGKNALAENNKNLPDNEAAFAKKDSAVIQQKTNDSAAVVLSLKQDTSAVVITKKQKTLHKWHVGILVEGGIAARSSSVLSLNSLMEKSNTNRSPAYFSLSAPGSSNSTVSGGFFNQEQINNGAAYGFGIALQKAINKKIDFFADVSYQHQSSKISAVTYYDSILLNGSSNVSLAGSYNATQAFHFASLSTGFNWHFINKKNLSFGISAGADNFFLLAEKQNFGNISSNNVTQDYQQNISRSALVKHDYYHYQPNVFAGILMNIKTAAHQQLQLTPFVRSSINKFEKNTSADNNHLFSGGLRVVYLFK